MTSLKFIHQQGLTRDDIFHAFMGQTREPMIQLERGPSVPTSIDFLLKTIKKIVEEKQLKNCVLKNSVILMMGVGVILKDNDGVRINPTCCVDLFWFTSEEDCIFAVSCDDKNIVSKLQFK